MTCTLERSHASELAGAARPCSLHLQRSDKAVSWHPPCSTLSLTGSCPYVQTRQVSASDSPCSQTLTMQIMQSCSLKMTSSSHPSLNHSMQAANNMGLHTSWAKLKFKMLPPDLHHLPVSYQDNKWKRSTGLYISAVMSTHRATVHQKFSGGLAYPRPLCTSWIVSRVRVGWVTLVSFASAIRVSCHHC